MGYSIFLAQVMSLYLIILSFSVYLNRLRMPLILDNLVDSPALLFGLGLIILIMGILLVVSHNVWVASWQVLVTLVAWLVLLKGILFVAFPESIRTMSRPYIEKPNMIYFSIAINLLIGLALYYYGFCAD